MKKNYIKRILSSLLVGALLISAVAGLSACSNDKNDNGKNYGTLNVSFPTGNIRVAINILALKLGYFSEEGVTVNPINLSGTNALTAINEKNGQLDILTAGFVPDLQAIASGYDLTFIAGTAVEGGSLVAKKGNAASYQKGGNGINIDAIANAKLGMVRNEAAWVVTRQYLLDNGVSAEVIGAIEENHPAKFPIMRKLQYLHKRYKRVRLTLHSCRWSMRFFMQMLTIWKSSQQPAIFRRTMYAAVRLHLPQDLPKSRTPLSPTRLHVFGHMNITGRARPTARSERM